jgi:hypothetical protein
VLVAEVVAETFSDVRCPLALVLGLPLSLLRVLAALFMNNPFIHGEAFFKNYKKQEVLERTNLPTFLTLFKNVI